MINSKWLLGHSMFHRYSHEASFYHDAEQIYLYFSSIFFLAHNISAVLSSRVDRYKCTLFTVCSFGSPALKANDDPTSIPWVSAPALFHKCFTGDPHRVTSSAGKLLTLTANCIRSRGGQRAATRMHRTGFTHHITEIMAAEEYTHTIVTQTYPLSLKQHVREDEQHTTTSLTHLSLSFYTQYCDVYFSKSGFWQCCFFKSHLSYNQQIIDDFSCEIYKETSF